MKLKIIIAFAALFTSAQTASAEFVVASGGRVRLQALGAFDQACHSLGPMAVNILRAPQGGTLSIGRVRDYPNFWSFNTRSRCNTMKLPETELMYQSSPGFVGDDVTAVEWIGPNGQAVRRYYRISVRPGVVPVPEAEGETPAPRRHAHHRAHAEGARHQTAAKHSRSQNRDAAPAETKIGT